MLKFYCSKNLSFLIEAKKFPYTPATFSLKVQVDLSLPDRDFFLSLPKQFIRIYHSSDLQCQRHVEGTWTRLELFLYRMDDGSRMTGWQNR